MAKLFELWLNIIIFNIFFNGENVIEYFLQRFTLGLVIRNKLIWLPAPVTEKFD